MKFEKKNVSVKRTGSKKWDQLGLIPELNTYISKKFEGMMPVQAVCIPQFLKKRDVAAEAATGSGKTLAFLLPLVHSLVSIRNEEIQNADDEDDTNDSDKVRQIRAVIMAPTRELGTQIHEILVEILVAVPHNFTPLLSVGGASLETEIGELRKANYHFVVVTTPGRLANLMDACNDPVNPRLSLKQCEWLVMDEADRLLELGFQRQLESVMKQIPKARRTGIFSATLTSQLKDLIRTGMRDPVFVVVKDKEELKVVEKEEEIDWIEQRKRKIEEGELPKKKWEKTEADFDIPTHLMPAGLTNTFVMLNPDEKLSYLVGLVQEFSKGPGKVIIFCMTCAIVDLLYDLLLCEIALRKEPFKGSHWKLGKTGAKEIRKKKRLGIFGDFHVEKIHSQMTKEARCKTFESFKTHSRGLLICTDVAARGVDIEDLHTVIQMDPPQDPAFFVHRVGRTARAGRGGTAITLINPNEMPFIDLMRKRDVPFTDFTQVNPSTITQHSKELHDLLQKRVITQDRAILQKTSNAFLSYVRAYHEHHLGFIFQFKELDVGRVGNLFLLLRLPRMKELYGSKRRGQEETFTRSDVDPKDVHFRDPKRETQRVANLGEELEKIAEKKEAWNESKIEDAKKKKNRERSLNLTTHAKKVMTRKRKAKDLEEINEDHRNIKKGQF